jgi:biofilm PGA synthesis protein PgaA
MKRAWLKAACLGGVLWGGGCAHHGPVPNELTEARAIYARASAGPARTLASARLAEAKEALAAAERAHLHGTPAEAEDRAYVAARRSELAEAEASTAVAGQRREAALHELASLTGVHADRARAELAATGGTNPMPVATTTPAAAPPDPGAAAAATTSPAPTMGLQPAREITGPQTPNAGPQPVPSTTTAAPPTPAAPGLQPARATESVSTTPPAPRDSGGAQAPSESVSPPVGLTTPPDKPSDPTPAP